MVKFCEVQFSLNFNWDQIARAFWCRYPNPYSNHVLSEDTISREVRDGKLYSKRLLNKTNEVPGWGKRFFNSRSVFIVEESIVDPVQQTIVTYTRNIGSRKIMTVDEKCVHSMCGNGMGTINKKVWVTSKVFGFSRIIETFSIKRLLSNSVAAKQGFEYVLEAMLGGQKPGENPATLPLLDRSKIKETAKKAIKLATSKANPLVAAACTNKTQTN